MAHYMPTRKTILFSAKTNQAIEESINDSGPDDCGSRGVGLRGLEASSMNT